MRSTKGFVVQLSLILNYTINFGQTASGSKKKLFRFSPKSSSSGSAFVLMKRKLKLPIRERITSAKNTNSFFLMMMKIEEYD